MTSADARPDHAVLPAAKQPVGSGATPLVGMLVALLVGALGVVGVQEALVRTGLVSARSWISRALTSADGRQATFALLVGSVVVILVGLWLVALAVRPRPRKALALRAETGVYLRGPVLAHVAESLVQGADSVTDVDASSTTSTLTLHVRTVEPAAGDSALEALVRERLSPCLDALDSRIRVRVDITHTELT